MSLFALLDEDDHFFNIIKDDCQKYPFIYFDFYSDPYTLLEMIDRYDVVFIDDHLSLMSVIDFFKLTKNSHYLKIVMTNNKRINIENLRYDIFYFMRKDDLDFKLCIKKICEELSKKNNQKLVLMMKKEIISIYYNDIYYIETDKNYVIIHALKDFRIRSTFKNILSFIDNEYLIIISYGVLVNMRHIMHIDFKNMVVVMNNHRIFSLSHRYKQEIKEKYKIYLF